MKKSISDTKPKSVKNMKVFWASIEYKYKVNPVKGPDFITNLAGDS